MGYMRHHAIVVTSWDARFIRAAHEEAKRLFSWVSPLSPDKINGYRSFFVPPDGSKEGWEESDLGDLRREAFVQWLDLHCHSDGSQRGDWAEIQYGDDNDEQIIVSATDFEERRQPEEEPPLIERLAGDLKVGSRLIWMPYIKRARHVCEIMETAGDAGARVYKLEADDADLSWWATEEELRGACIWAGEAVG